MCVQPAVVVACMPACMMAGPAIDIRLPPACAAVLPACTACSLPRLRDVLLFHMSDPAQVPEPILESDLVSSSSTGTHGSNAWLTFASLASTPCQLPTNCASIYTCAPGCAAHTRNCFPTRAAAAGAGPLHPHAAARRQHQR